MDLIRGAGYLLRGIRLVFVPALRRFLLIPLLVNIGVFTLLIWLSIDRFGDLMNWLLPAGHPLWAEALRVLVWVIFAGITLLIGFFTFSLGANLIAAPFNGLLSENVERYLTGDPRPQGTGGFRTVWRSIGPALRDELRKLTYFAGIGALVLIISLVPALNVIAPLLWVVYSAWMLALEYLSYPMETQSLSFREIRAQLAARRGLSFGFGLAVLGVTLIPLVNFFVMPSAVAGATALWVDHCRSPKRAAGPRCPEGDLPGASRGEGATPG